MKYDRSFWSLLTANVITIIFALFGHWSLGTLVWVYWWQSFVILLLNFITILSLKKYSTDGYNANGFNRQADGWTKARAAITFFLFYGLFFSIYYGYLKKYTTDTNAMLGENSYVNWWDVMLGAGLFMANHIYSFIYQKHQERKNKKLPKIAHLLYQPFFRIFPLHLAFFGFIIGTWGVMLFLFLKTISDQLAHIWEQRMKNK